MKGSILSRGQSIPAVWDELVTLNSTPTCGNAASPSFGRGGRDCRSRP